MGIELGFNYHWHIFAIGNRLKKRMGKIYTKKRADKYSKRLFIQTHLQVEMLSDKKKNPHTEWDISVYLLIFFALFWSTRLGLP